MEIVWIFGGFLVCAVIILIAGSKVAKYGDIIAEKTGLGRIWIGVTLMAIATSLPEMFNGISATLIEEPDLTIGNIFGANAFNLLTLAILDTIFRGYPPLLSKTTKGNLLTLGLSMVLMSIAAAGILTGHAGIELNIGWIGIHAPVILLLYLLAVRMIFKYETGQKSSAQLPGDVKMTSTYGHLSLKRTYIYYGTAAAFVIVAGIMLAVLSDRIAEITGLGKHFVGMLLISFVTTLPEMTVTFAALRLGAIDMAIGNMFGSSLYNVAIIAIIDPIFRAGPILSYASIAHIITFIAVAMMSGIVIAAMIFPPKRRMFLGASWYAIAIMGIFFIAAYLNFIM